MRTLQETLLPSLDSIYEPSLIFLPRAVSYREPSTIRANAEEEKKLIIFQRVI